MLFLGVLVGVGILKGLLVLVVVFNLMLMISGVYKIWYFVGDVIFYFLFVFLVFIVVK